MKARGPVTQQRIKGKGVEYLSSARALMAIGMSVGYLLTACTADQAGPTHDAVPATADVTKELSVDLPSGFNAMPGNSPPVHETYVKRLDGNNHTLTFSADRRPLKELSKYLKQQDYHMFGPMVAGLLTVEILGLKAKTNARRAGFSPKTNFFSVDPYKAFPDGSCDGFRWTANFRSENAGSSFYGQGITVACVFWSENEARMTVATVSEQSKSFDDLSRGYLISIAYPILKSLKY